MGALAIPPRSSLCDRFPQNDVPSDDWTTEHPGVHSCVGTSGVAKAK